MSVSPAVEKGRSLVATGQSKPPAPNKSGFHRSLEKCEHLYISASEPPAWFDSLQQVYGFAGWLGSQVLSRQRWEKAREILSAAPPADELSQHLQCLEAATEGGADERATRGMIGMLLDAYPHGRPTQAFADTLLHDLVSMGFSPEVVARACQTVRRTCKFAPSVAEVVEACRAHQKEIGVRLAMVRRAARLLEQAAEIAERPAPVEPVSQEA